MEIIKASICHGLASICHGLAPDELVFTEKKKKTAEKFDLSIIKRINTYRI